MNKLYRLVEAEGASFSVYGIRLGVRMNKIGLLGRIAAYLPLGSRIRKTHTVQRLYSFVLSAKESRTGTRRFHLLYANSEILGRAENQEELFEVFEFEVNRYLAQTVQSRFFVHAGVVGWKGKAIVIPGSSHSGKTTLVKEFVKRGATYYSDEYAVFDERAFVYPFARTLSLRDQQTQKQTRVHVEELGSKTGKRPVPVGLLLFTQFKQSALWKPRRISPAMAALRLLANSFSASTQRDISLNLIERIVAGANILCGVRGEAKALVEDISVLPRHYSTRFPTTGKA
jgi:hypothetical protein